jgi:hypothetical protein
MAMPELKRSLPTASKEFGIVAFFSFSLTL